VFSSFVNPVQKLSIKIFGRGGIEETALTVVFCFVAVFYIHIIVCGYMYTIAFLALNTLTDGKFGEFFHVQSNKSNGLRSG
jgi:hypothetical protein